MKKKFGNRKKNLQQCLVEKETGFSENCYNIFNQFFLERNRAIQ